MRIVNTEHSRKSAGHYSPGVITGNLLFISGQLSKDPATGQVPPGGIGPETRQALANVELVLQAAGLRRENVVLCHIYIPDVALWDEVNAVYAEFFGAHKPARAVIPTTRLHGDCLVEIEAVAELSE
jgi:reactive intermediate/imine deaminase